MLENPANPDLGVPFGVTSEAMAAESEAGSLGAVVGVGGVPSRAGMAGW